jgi:hypothetical protein
MVLLVGCGPSSREQRNPDGGAAGSGQPAAVVRVTGHGVDEGNASICEDFRLTDAQAEQFFANAVAATPEQIHDDYDVLPCWVQGTTGQGTAQTTWKIRAGGTAEVTAPDGNVSYFGCKTCDDILQ